MTDNLDLELLRSYASGPKIWDATAILPGVWALADRGLIEPVGDEARKYQLTTAGRDALKPTAEEIRELEDKTHTEAEARHRARKRGVLGGVQPDPDFGKPNRHTRQKCRLMLADLSPAQTHIVLRQLINKRPEDVLDAILEVVGDT